MGSRIFEFNRNRVINHVKYIQPLAPPPASPKKNKSKNNFITYNFVATEACNQYIIRYSYCAAYFCAVNKNREGEEVALKFLNELMSTGTACNSVPIRVEKLQERFNNFVPGIAPRVQFTAALQYLTEKGLLVQCMGDLDKVVFNVDFVKMTLKQHFGKDYASKNTSHSKGISEKHSVHLLKATSKVLLPLLRLLFLIFMYI